MKASTKLALVVAVVLAGCGGSGSDEPMAVDSGFLGTWTGSNTLVVSGLSPVSYAAQVRITRAGSSIQATNVCPAAGDPHGMIFSGSGAAATWSGYLDCNPVAFGGCDSVVFEYVNVYATLYSGGTLAAQGDGTATGCGWTRDFTFSFSGAK